MYRRNAAIRLSVNFPWMSLRRCHINMENHRGCRAWAMCLRLMRFVWSRKDRSQGFSPSGQEAERRGRCRLEWLGRDCMACVTESRKGLGRVGMGGSEGAQCRGSCRCGWMEDRTSLTDLVAGPERGAVLRDLEDLAFGA